ncbi:hypothetical protein DENSPDRAFT_862081 [Dentipellis sp. KUC8613]|nr:hypothetical protein DENSPDRAFT_862081 [Dentipellis sp. KUC8613]
MFRASEKIHGYSVPGLTKSVLISLFADDTALYLRKADRIQDVEEILDQWCLVSGAKFNKEKTEIIPIGTPEHRARVLETRKLHEDDPQPLEDGIHIVSDGDSIRYLGAWIGNHADDHTPWTPVLDKLRNALERWGKGRPTLHGKSLIVQMIVGGMTQFLAKVQGMPPTLETAVIKIIRDFIWDGKPHPPVALDYLYLPREEAHRALPGHISQTSS